MINGDRGEGNLDDDYDINEGAATPVDDIDSMDDDEHSKRPELEDDLKPPQAQSHS